jgi:membrane associated rhomboid family serine protease
MAGRFSYSRPDRRGATDPWFRLGEVDVGSAAFLAVLAAFSILLYGLEPRDKPILNQLALKPADVFGGQVWRIVTWPLANGFSQGLLWTAISVAMLWYFGSRVEEQIGRVRMTVLLVLVIVVPGILGALLDLPQFGIESVRLAVLLIFVAEFPQLRFFFGIPAWVIGVVVVLTDVLQLSGARANRQLLFYLLSLGVAALAARAVGLLTAYPWLPQLPLPASLTGERSPARRRPASRPSIKRRRGGGSVVPGPWSPPTPNRPGPEILAAQAELDLLLDKISAGGLESLDDDEKRRLNELSKRLR